MAEKTIRTIIQLRRDTEANWLAVADTFVPRAGEPCVTLDGDHKGQIKMGDGTSTWGQLEYIGEGTNVAVDGKALINVDGTLSIDGFADATEGQQPRKAADGTIEWYSPDTSTVEGLSQTVGQLQTDVDALEAVVGNAEAGLVKDVADNTAAIAENKTLLDTINATVGNSDSGLVKQVNDLVANITNNYDTSDEVDEKIASAITSTYKAGGSVDTVAEISVDATHEGYVYNMTAEFTTTDAFVEGAGKVYPAGTNVVVIQIPGDPVSYKLDVMSGFVDLSNYATKDELATKTTQEIAGTNGTSYVWNENSGGGARFVHNDGTESFVGVNDGGENGMVAQIYADKNVDGNWIGTRVNVYQKGAFYFNAEDKASDSYVGDDPAHEIATLGDIPEDKIYYTNKICSLTTGAGASEITAAIGSWDELYQAIMDNKIIVDTEIEGQGDATWSNPRPAVTASAQGNVVIHLTFHITTQRMVHCEIQNVGGSPLAIAVDDYYIGDASVTNNNKTVIDSLPDQIISELVNVARTETTNTAELRIFTKQDDGTYSPDVQHGVLTLIPAGQGPDGVNGAGLMTAADKTKLDSIDAENIVYDTDDVILDGGSATVNVG